MALNSRNDPQYWQNRADEARAIAVQMTDRTLRRQCLPSLKITTSSPCGRNGLAENRRLREIIGYLTELVSTLRAERAERAEQSGSAET